MSKRIVFHVDVNSAFLSWTATQMVNEGKEDIRLVPSIDSVVDAIRNKYGSATIMPGSIMNTKRSKKK